MYEMREHEATMLQTWITTFEENGGGIIRVIEKKKEIFGLLKQWHSVFDDCSDNSRRGEFPKSSSIFLLSLFGDAKLPTHRWSSLTFAFELKPPDIWVPDVHGIPGEFVLFDSNLRWSVVVTHEETTILFS
jgi:hypothetical protein